MRIILLAAYIVMIGKAPAQSQATPTHSSPLQEGSEKAQKLNEKAENQLLSQPDSAFLNANSALLTAKDAGDHLEEANSLYLLGMVLFHQGLYVQSLEHFLQAERLFLASGNKQRVAADLNQQGLIYYNIRQQEKALASHQLALSYYEELKDKKGIAYSLGCIGRLYEKSKNYKASYDHQLRSLEIYRSIGDRQGESTILENLGSILEDQEDYPGALEYFRQSLALNQLTGDSLGMIINLNNVGDNYRKTGDYSHALEYSARALELAKRLNDKYQISSAYKDLSKSYHLAGDDKHAYANLELGRTLYEEIFAQEAVRQMALLQTVFEIERQNSAIRELNNAQKLDTAIRIFLISILILLSVLGFVVISRQRLKIIRDRARSDQNRQVYETENRLIQAELENTHLREETLKQELETNSKSLTAQTIHIMGKNKMLEDIQARLSGLLTLEREEQRRKVKEAIRLIDHNFMHDKEWEDFNRTFGRVHGGFFEKLNARSKELTPADLRLAALIRLNIPSSDIAATLGISTDSLRVSRYRLKKKLALEEGESLTGFINSIS